MRGKEADVSCLITTVQSWCVTSLVKGEWKRPVRVGSEGPCGGVCGASARPSTVQLCSSPLCMTGVHYCCVSCTSTQHARFLKKFLVKKNKNKGTKEEILTNCSHCIFLGSLDRMSMDLNFQNTSKHSSHSVPITVEIYICYFWIQFVLGTKDFALFQYCHWWFFSLCSVHAWIK